MTSRKSLRGAGIAVALTMAVAGVARADDAGDKAQLEQRVRDLERELSEVKSTLRGGYFTANSDLEARVGELERMAAADNSMSSMFKSGLKTEGGDGAFRYQWFGLIQNDWLWYHDDGDRDVSDAIGAELNPGVEFRRIRLGANGEMYGNVRWWSELEFSGGEGVSLADMWIELAHCMFGNVRVGHMKEPIGFDQLTGDRTLQFMERSTVTALSPVRNTGIMMHGLIMEDGPQSWLYQVGMFRDSNAAGDDLANAKDGEYNFSGRISGRPMVQDDGATWLHIGLSSRYSDYADDSISRSSGLPFAQAPGFFGTPIEADWGWQFGLEAALVAGQWTFLGEYAREKIHLDTGRDPAIDAWSLEAGYWLTGENTGYDKNKGTWGRAMPKQNFGDGDGGGAWRLSLRYDTIDLDDGGLDGGDLDRWTFGVSWLLNPNTGVHFNVGHADTGDDFLDDVTAIGLRFEIDF